MSGPWRDHTPLTPAREISRRTEGHVEARPDDAFEWVAALCFLAMLVGLAVGVWWAR